VRYLVPDTLAGRTIAILLIGLGLFHLWSIWIYQTGTAALLGSTQERQLADRMVSVSRAIAELPRSERDRTAHALSSADMEIHWSPASLVNEVSVGSQRIELLRERLRELISQIADNQVHVGFADEQTTADGDNQSDRHLLLASLQLQDGSWVNFSAATFRRPGPTEHGVLGSLTAMALGILIVSILLVRSMTAPLRALANAAHRLGIDLAAPGLPQQGPREVRQAAKAFNLMQARIRRLINDRTQTLAAVSHDLKTPITRLRLRTEFIHEEELRRMIDADLDEMERMLDSTLAFLRGDATGEESKVVDVGTILETICNGLTDGGHDVVLSGNSHANLRCKPLAIKRALANVIDNAIKYGTSARVALQDKTEELVVTIDDEGPGIPEAEQEKVFDPFYRVEGSRSRETGGTGLGLTVARTVIRAHGGDIVLGNRDDRGLRVTVSLPKATNH
jgi:signal transduction histidine kinase